MDNSNYRKLKLLKLLEILNRDTDEQNPLSTNELCKRLADVNIPCDRRTLSVDVKLLNDNGFEIMSRRVGYDKAYYIEDRSFDLSELKVLMDAVQAAAFVTEKKTTELLDKIAALGGTHKAKLLKENTVCFNTRKHTNETIYYSVSCIEEAIRKKKKISFYYFDIDENGERVFRKDKALYIVSPSALIYNEDNYYLVAYSSADNESRNYRLDRMMGVELTKDPIAHEAIIPARKMSKFTEQAFKMYAGEVETAVLEFDKQLIGIIYDKFGENTKIKKVNDRYQTKVEIQVSPTFWGWICQFPGELKIVGNEKLVAEYRNWVNKLISCF